MPRYDAPAAHTPLQRDARAPTHAVAAMLLLIADISMLIAAITLILFDAAITLAIRHFRCSISPFSRHWLSFSPLILRHY
jgi:hypothetical protein